MKKIIILFLILFAQNSYAEVVPNPCLSSGAYASVGLSNLVRGDLLKLSNQFTHFTFFRAPDSGNDIGYSFLLGYQRLINNFLLGANGVYRYFPGPDSKGVKLNAISAPRVTTNSNFGLELRPGFLINPQVSFYGILGLESTYYKVRYLFNETNITFSNWQYGTGIGIGSDIALPCKFRLMLNYLYIKYDHLNFLDRGNATNVVLEPIMNIFTLAISYQFLG